MSKIFFAGLFLVTACVFGSQSPAEVLNQQMSFSSDFEQGLLSTIQKEALVGGLCFMSGTSMSLATPATLLAAHASTSVMIASGALCIPVAGMLCLTGTLCLTQAYRHAQELKEKSEAASYYAQL